MQTQPIGTTRRTAPASAAPRRTVNLPPPPAAEKQEEKEPESQLAAGLSSLTLPPPPAAPAAAAGGMSLPPPPSAAVAIPQHRGPGRPAATRTVGNFKEAKLTPAALNEFLTAFPIFKKLSVDNVPVPWAEEKLKALKLAFGENLEEANDAIRLAVSLPFKFIPEEIGTLAEKGEGAEIDFINFKRYMEAFTNAALNLLKSLDTELGQTFRERLESAVNAQATLPPPPAASPAPDGGKNLPPAPAGVM